METDIVARQQYRVVEPALIYIGALSNILFQNKSMGQ